MDELATGKGHVVGIAELRWGEVPAMVLYGVRLRDARFSVAVKSGKNSLRVGIDVFGGIIEQTQAFLRVFCDASALQILQARRTQRDQITLCGGLKVALNLRMCLL